MDTMQHICHNCLDITIQTFNHNADTTIENQSKKAMLAYYEFTQSLKSITITSDKEFHRNTRLTKSQPLCQPMYLNYKQSLNVSRHTMDSSQSKESGKASPSFVLNNSKTLSPFIVANNCALKEKDLKEDAKWSLEHPQLNLLKKQKTLFSSSGEINKNWPDSIAQKLIPPSTFSPLEECDLKE